jgi:hypothetical protein
MATGQHSLEHRSNSTPTPYPRALPFPRPMSRAPCAPQPGAETERELFEGGIRRPQGRTLAAELAFEHRLHADHEHDAPHLHPHRAAQRVEFCQRPRQDLGRARSSDMFSRRSIFSPGESARHWALERPALGWLRYGKGTSSPVTGSTMPALGCRLRGARHRRDMRPIASTRQESGLARV